MAMKPASAAAIKPSHKAIQQYYQSLKDYGGVGVKHEGAVETAFQRLLEQVAKSHHCHNTVYERFFQGYSVKVADTHGIVYTPQEIVDFMCASVEEVLQREFGSSIAEPGVQILDPCVGTGSFIVNLLHRIPRHKLKHKYLYDLFCNEIMLLP